MLIFFAFDNDDMESSKRRVTFFSVDFSFKMFLLVSKFKMVGMPLNVVHGRVQKG